MSTKRFLLLTLGPVILIFISYWVTFELPHSSGALAAARTLPVERSPVLGSLSVDSVNPALAGACSTQAEALIRRLGAQHQAIVEAPFVIAGNLPKSDLQRIYRSTIEPIVYALRNSYFRTPPDRPITLVMLESVDSYRRVALELDEYDAVDYHGYYRRDERRIVLDLSSGNGTLAHELTHALLGFDFPDAPEWFDEGLASLHEQGEFTEDGETLLGRHNWRLHALKQAVRTNQLEPLEALIRSEGFRREGEGLHYAQVRYFCLYLQHLGLLKDFYRQFREAVDHDPTGLATLCRLLEVETLSQIDEEFRIWLRMEFHRLSRAKG